MDCTLLDYDSVIPTDIYVNTQSDSVAARLPYTTECDMRLPITPTTPTPLLDLGFGPPTQQPPAVTNADGKGRAQELSPEAAQPGPHDRGHKTSRAMKVSPYELPLSTIFGPNHLLTP